MYTLGGHYSNNGPQILKADPLNKQQFSDPETKTSGELFEQSSNNAFDNINSKSNIFSNIKTTYD